MPREKNSDPGKHPDRTGNIMVSPENFIFVHSSHEVGHIPESNMNWQELSYPLFHFIEEVYVSVLKVRSESANGKSFSTLYLKLGAKIINKWSQS